MPKASQSYISVNLMAFGGMEKFLFPMDLSITQLNIFYSFRVGVPSFIQLFAEGSECKWTVCLLFPLQKRQEKGLGLPFVQLNKNCT